MTSTRLSELAAHARAIRRTALTMIYESQTSHVGCAFSFADILTALYFDVLHLDPDHPDDPARDRVILSKGHAVAGLYAALAERGFVAKERFADYCRDGSRLASHIVRGVVPGAETSNGSGGHGLPLGVGMALALRQEQRPSRVFVLSGDGEMQEGSVWEAMLFAGVHQLANLVLVVDSNHFQDGSDGTRLDNILSLQPLADKVRAFGWEAEEVDGHDLGALVAALGRRTGLPRAVIAHTIKGKGVSYMENLGVWHGRVPTDREYEIGMRELS